MKSLEKAARGQEEYVVELRRALHRHPETRYETEATRRRILDEIHAANAGNQGNAVIREPRESKGGIVVDIDVDGNRDRILFRADFDALPVPEMTGLPCASRREGISHACGHDAHTAMLLGFLRCVSEGSVAPAHNIRLVFQDAEENPGMPPEPVSGGDLLVQEGVLDGISAAYALHIWTGEEAHHGMFLSRPGALLGNSGRVRFLFAASGGHAGRPHMGVNALRVAHAAMSRLDMFAARFFSPADPIALEPVILNTGTGSNVIPARAELWYGFRTLLPRDRHVAMMEKCIAEVRAVAESMEAEFEATPLYGHPALINDTAVFDRVGALLREYGQEVKESPPMLGGEDFAHYLYGVPGAMFTLEAYTPGSGRQHTPLFNPDETVFRKGVLFWAILATN